jgi:electron transfer flavoprotein alpha subunit
MTKSIVIVSEHESGRLRPITFELASFAFALRRDTGMTVKVLVIGEDLAGPAGEISTATGFDVLAVRVPGLFPHDAATYQRILHRLMIDLEPALICFGHTGFWLDVAAGLAVKMNASCIPGVDRLYREDNRTLFGRAVYNGKMAAAVSAEREPVIITVQPGSCSFDAEKPAQAGRIEWRNMRCPEGRCRFLGRRQVRRPDAALAEARVIVSAGRGIGKQENLDLIYRLADAFPKSAVGGSRLLCDMGRLPYRQQVGVTGNTVSPELYVACGISGAAQHLSGMKDAGFVVAINTDPDAAIFSVSDVIIVEDLRTFIPMFLTVIEEQKNDEEVMP